jgi:hypothetical protein
MKKQIAIIILLISSTLSLSAQEKHKPFQIALYNPVQIVSQEISVHGFRWNVLYGENENMVGFDMGIVNKTNGLQRGAQIGIVSITKGDFEGFRMGVVNIGEGNMNGYTRGMVNLIGGEGNGWASGGVNVLDDNFTGLISGVVNVQYAKQLKGAMIGVVNVINEPKEEIKDGKKIKRKGTQIGLVNITESMKGVQIGLININKSAKIKFFPFILIKSHTCSVSLGFILCDQLCNLKV